VVARRSPRRIAYLLLEDADYRSPVRRLGDAFLIVLILANAIAIALESDGAIMADHGSVLRAFEVFSVAVFTVEYLCRLWAAAEISDNGIAGAWRARARYLISPLALIDLMAIAPFYLAAFFAVDLRVLRLLRALRILKLTRYSPALATMAAVARKESPVIVGALAILVVVAMIAATLIHYLEAEAQPQQFGSIPLAMWWVIETLTTVGYGDAIPVTLGGRIVGAVVMILGIGVFVMWTSIFAVGFLEETRRRNFVVTWHLVARVPLFSGLDAERIAEIAGLLAPETVVANTTVMRQGEIADSLYFIAAGDVAIDLAGRVLHLGPGHFFGELALIEETPQQTTATTLTECQLLRLDGADFRALMESEPDMEAEIRRIAEERRRHGQAALREDPEK